jgi:hypothetical protein
MGPQEDTFGRLDVEVVQRLRDSRPIPDPLFVEALEQRLLPKRRREPRRARRPLLMGSAAVAATAAAALVLSLAGAGPLAPGGEKPVQAGDDCRYVTVTRPDRVPVIVTGSDGEPKVVFRERRVERRVKRCR